MGFRCDKCEFELLNPLAQPGDDVIDSFSHLGLYNDARFPGRCTLVFGAHVEHFSDLTASDVQGFGEALQNAELAIRVATGASRVNIALLGNAVPHLHYHLIPRFPRYESLPMGAPWDDERDRMERLTETEMGWLSTEISVALRTIHYDGMGQALEQVARWNHLEPAEPVHDMLRSHWPEGPSQFD